MTSAGFFQTHLQITEVDGVDLTQSEPQRDEEEERLPGVTGTDLDLGVDLDFAALLNLVDDEHVVHGDVDVERVGRVEGGYFPMKA